MAEERLRREDKCPIVLFSSVGAEPLKGIHESGKYINIIIVLND